MHTDGFDGKELVIVNVGEGQLRFLHESTSSATTNRLILGNAGVSVTILNNDSATFRYDNITRRWRLISAFF